MCSVVAERQCSDVFSSFYEETIVLGPILSPLFNLNYQHCGIIEKATVHGVLKARILKWFAISFSCGPHSVRPLHHDPTVLGPTRHGLVSLS